MSESGQQREFRPIGREYVRMFIMGRRLIWYASYGSNLSAERFACYLAGGRPSGATRTFVGARDTSPPLDVVALKIPYQLYFSGATRTWGGSPAFIDTTPLDQAIGLARAYLISWDQFEDVVAQENGRPSRSIDIDDHNLVPGFSQQIGSGRYENLLCIEHLHSLPIVTFTAPWSMSEVTPGCPSAAYLAMLITGLRDAHHLSDEELTSYLESAPGCSRNTVMAALGLVRHGGGVSEPRTFGLAGHSSSGSLLQDGVPVHEGNESSAG